MRIALLSDTHGYMDDRILHHCELVDEIWHAGDVGAVNVIQSLEEIKPTRVVYGNIDGQDIRKIAPLHQRFVLEDVDVWMTHIGGYPPRYEPRVREEMYANPPKLFISGHSHILKVVPDKRLGLLHINPGAAGKHGFHKMRTMVRFSLNTGKIEELEVVELGKR